MSIEVSKFPLWKQGEIIQNQRLLDVAQDLDTLPGAEHLKHILRTVELTPKQTQFMNATQFIQVLTGGDKSGKTFTAICKAIRLAHKNMPHKILFVHPTADGNKITVLPLLEEILEKNNIEYSVKLLATKIIVKLYFGSGRFKTGTIILASGDKPKSLKGPNFAAAIIDEPFIQKQEIFQVVISRLAADAKERCLILCGTPEPLHMVWGEKYLKKKFVNTPELFVITISARDNPYNSPEYIANLEAEYDAKTRRARIDGEYVNLSQNAAYSFEREKNVIEHSEAVKLCFDFEKDNKNLVLSFDFNVNPMTAVLWYQYNDDYIQMKEYKVSHSHTKELTELVISNLIAESYLMNYGDGRYCTLFGNSLLVTGDASGRSHKSSSEFSDFEIIEDKFRLNQVAIEMCVPPKNPEVRDRINFVNIRLENGNIKISSECENSINDRERVEWKKGADKFVIDKSNNEVTHLSEAADYGLWNTRNLTLTQSGTNVYAIQYNQR